jgi:hypothetical protein
MRSVLSEYVSNMPPGHARVRMEEATHIRDTNLAWIGDFSYDGVFYYRVQSPVILIELDHQAPIAL